MRRRTLALIGFAILSAWPLSAKAGELAGRVRDADGRPVVGAMLTVQRGDPRHARTVFSDADGAFRVSDLAPAEDYSVRFRRVGWKQQIREGQTVGAAPVQLELRAERELDPAVVAAQLPANRWYALALERVTNPEHREVLVRQCTYCHQQGSWATRKQREREEWDKVLLLMGRMGAFLPNELREDLPDILNAAYDPAHAVPALTAGMGSEDFAPPPPPEVRRAVVDEWELGHRASMQHDIVVHPDGRIYSVDMSQDQLHRLDVRDGGAVRESWQLPDAGLPLGGMFGSSRDAKTPSNSNAHVGPHSIQVAPDGSLWMTLAIGNRLARFDPGSEEFSLVETEEGWYPHTLRFDGRGRIWYTLAASNHVGMYDPATGEHERIRLPARTFSQAVVLRMLPVFLWLSKHVDVRGKAAGAGEGMSMPVPYGIDVAPDGAIWLSQLNEHRIARVDPDSFEIEIVETPFTGPRRLRFDSQGKLWIPGFSAGLVSRFDPQTRSFESWDLPIEPKGSDVPYALHVDRRTDTVWICGTNSDSLIRFEPESERFSVYPLPTRVTFTREIDFDAQGRVWTSNSNAPTWQIEGGFPRVLRLDPGVAADATHTARTEDSR
jgi:streptogramin lyase